jgi:hypothetical protein
MNFHGIVLQNYRFRIGDNLSLKQEDNTVFPYLFFSERKNPFSTNLPSNVTTDCIGQLFSPDKCPITLDEVIGGS